MLVVGRPVTVTVDALWMLVVGQSLWMLVVGRPVTVTVDACCRKASDSQCGCLL